jgi:hypothetical protein
MAAASIDTVAGTALAGVEIERIDAYWRAANYLSVGQIYLHDNPLLREPPRAEHVKPRLLGHWGTTPGLNFVYVHLDRVIRERDLDCFYVAGPGTADRDWWPTPTSRAPTARSIPTCPRTPPGCSGCSSNSRSPGESRATSPPRWGLHSRGRRARLRPLARLPRRIRQP